MAIPFVAGDELIGCVLGVYQGRVPEINFSFMGTLSRQVAVALNNAILLDQVQHTKDANHDILQGLPAGVILCDEHLRIIGFNRLAERLIGCSYGDAIGAPFSSLCCWFLSCLNLNPH